MVLRHDIRRGALCMLGATLLFAVMGAIAKHLTETLPVPQVMFFRASLALPVVLAVGLRSHATLRTKRFGGHLSRAILGTVSMSFGFYTLAVLPLAEQTALNYTAPLFVTMLSIVFLSEQVGIHRWGAVLLGFLGVLIIAFGKGGGPDASLPMLGIIAGLAGGLSSAIITLLVRQLSSTESSATIVLWQSILMSLILAMVLPFVWVEPNWTEAGLMLAMGLIGGMAQVFMTEAYASSQISAIGPYSYTGLIWAGTLGWLIWGTVPGFAMICGSLLIVAAGIYILHRELLRNRRAR